VGERRSTDWTVRRSVTFGAGFWTFPSSTRGQHRIVLHLKECHCSRNWRRAF
jgi:hypothetical protein